MPRFAVVLTCAALIAFVWQAGAKGAVPMTAPGHAVVTIGGKQLTGRTHAIAVPEKPTPQERHAAEELQSHLLQITGEAIPIVSETDLGERTPLVVGKCVLLAKPGVKVDLAALGEEGISLRTVGPALVLAGNRRGVLYAVYTFLEDYLGCRWFTPDCSRIPHAGSFHIANLDRTYVPPLEYRSTDYPNSRDADWAVRNKLNGSYVECDEARGGKIEYRGFVHTFNSLVPPERYFGEHPAYYSEESTAGARARARPSSASPIPTCSASPPRPCAAGCGSPRRPGSSPSPRTTGTTTASVQTARRSRTARGARPAPCFTS